MVSTILSIFSKMFSALFQILFNDTEGLQGFGETVLLIGPQLCYYILYILFTALFIKAACHVYKYRDRSMLLRAAKFVLGMDASSTFVPYYLNEKQRTQSTKKSVSKDAICVKRHDRRVNALREIKELKRKLLSMSEQTFEKEQIGAVEDAMGQMDDQTIDLLKAKDGDIRIVTDANYGMKRQLSAREELLRRRGNSLESACRLLDASLDTHYHASNLHRRTLDVLHHRKKHQIQNIPQTSSPDHIRSTKSSFSPLLNHKKHCVSTSPLLNKAKSITVRLKES